MPHIPSIGNINIGAPIIRATARVAPTMPHIPSIGNIKIGAPINRATARVAPMLYDFCLSETSKLVLRSTGQPRGLPLQCPIFRLSETSTLALRSIGQPRGLPLCCTIFVYRKHQNWCSDQPGNREDCPYNAPY